MIVILIQDCLIVSLAVRTTPVQRNQPRLLVGRTRRIGHIKRVGHTRQVPVHLKISKWRQKEQDQNIKTVFVGQRLNTMKTTTKSAPVLYKYVTVSSIFFSSF